jgi:hypothetical protein
MIDMPPKVPVQQEQVIEKKLIDCGLDAKTFTVKYEDYLQSIEIVITRKAAVSKAQFACINRAAGFEIVTFEDRALQSAYRDFANELYRPQMIAEATARLEKLGLLDGFPRRSAFGSLEEYARALERHCGLAPGSALTSQGEDILFDPPRDWQIEDFEKRYSKILAAGLYADAIGDVKHFYFVSHATIAETGGK